MTDEGVVIAFINVDGEISNKFLEPSEDIVAFLASKEDIISFEIAGIKISLYSDNGVFSKGKLDEGTRILLKSVLSLPLEGKILDLGCAIGTIGLTILKKFDNVSVTCSDVNLRALELAKHNAVMLGVDQRINIVESDVFSNIDEKEFDYIITNPPIRAGKKITYKMYEESIKHLKSGGSLFVVIRKAQGASSASKYIKEIFGNIVLVNREKGYHIYQAINMK